MQKIDNMTLQISTRKLGLIGKRYRYSMYNISYLWHHNNQKMKDERTNNDFQNTTQKTKDRVTQTPLITGVNSGAPEG